jgi:hypothetical protein
MRLIRVMLATLLLALAATAVVGCGDDDDAVDARVIDAGT